MPDLLVHCSVLTFRRYGVGGEGWGAAGLQKQGVVSFHLVSVEGEDLVTPELVVHELIVQYV